MTDEKVQQLVEARRILSSGIHLKNWTMRVINSLAQEMARSSIEHFKGVNRVNQESFAHHDEITFLDECTKRGGKDEETICHHGCFGAGHFIGNDFWRIGTSSGLQSI